MCRLFFLIVAFISAIGFLPANSQSFTKNISVTVRDPKGNLINKAQVTYKGAVGKAVTRPTDANGIATFNILVLLTPVKGTITVNDGDLHKYKNIQIPITLTEYQNDYSVPVTFESGGLKTVLVKVKDSKGRDLEGAQVIYKAPNATQTKYTDGGGFASFEVTMVTSPMDAEISVADKQIMSGDLSAKATVTLTDAQDHYEVPFSLMSDYKNIIVKVNGDDGVLMGAKVRIKGANNTNDITGYTDANGIAKLEALLIAATAKLILVMSFSPHLD